MNPEEMLPLSPSVFYILLALADEERHGYGIMQEVARLTDGAVRLGPGKLYGSIKRMLAAELIEEVQGDRQQAKTRQRRRTYRATPTGMQAARLEVELMRNLVWQARLKNLLPKGGTQAGIA